MAHQGTRIALATNRSTLVDTTNHAHSEGNECSFRQLLDVLCQLYASHDISPITNAKSKDILRDMVDLFPSSQPHHLLAIHSDDTLRYTEQFDSVTTKGDVSLLLVPEANMLDVCGRIPSSEEFSDEEFTKTTFKLLYFVKDKTMKLHILAAFVQWLKKAKVNKHVAV